MNKLTEQVGEALRRVRETKPLLHHITNLVVMNDTANVTLHVGALPVMAHAPEEVEEMTAVAGALVLNIGTLTVYWTESMLAAGRRANQRGIPVVMDPVGAGATTLRTETSHRLLQELDVAILRGNAGELGALAGAGGLVRGVESIEGVSNPATVTASLARTSGVTVAMSGKRDYVSDGARLLGVDNGHHWLTTVTGTGCMATTMIGAFAAVERDRVVAAAGALACFGLAAERAAESARGPASFKIALLDELYHLTPEALVTGARITEIPLDKAGVGRDADR